MSRQSQVIWPGFELEFHQDGQWVRTELSQPDEKWRLVDEAGHGHFFDEAAKAYPTLRWVQLPCSMGHGDECTAEGYYECPLCSERVRPGTKPIPDQWIAGMQSYTLTVADEQGQSVYSFGRDEWEQLQTTMRATVADMLGEFRIGWQS